MTGARNSYNRGCFPPAQTIHQIHMPITPAIIADIAKKKKEEEEITIFRLVFQSSITII